MTPVLPQIKTVVYLMLENRSLDNMLGWLYASKNPAVVFPPGSCPQFNGVPPGKSNKYTNILGESTTFPVENGTTSFNLPCRIPNFDPNEPMPNVLNQLYADSKGDLPSGYCWANKPPMTGFAWDYHDIYEDQPGQVMGAFAPEQLPVLSGLASNFAVSDRWFSSVPTQTDPNRAFSVCGTSLGAERNSDISDKTYQGTPTLFNALGKAGKTWTCYSQMDDPLGTGEPLLSWAPFTPYYFSQMNSAENGIPANPGNAKNGVDRYANFLTQCADGVLPNFCYLEPYWGGGKGDPVDNTKWTGIQGNDYHPPAWVGPAESDLNTLYEALVSSPQWSNMLFVVTFDEHGGTYDHEPPTKACRPDASVGQSGFKFDRLGVRVPTILVSPFVEAGTVFRAPSGSQYDFDHTSFIATMLKWAGVDPTTAGLGARVAAAPTFEDVLSATPRTDKPAFTVPGDYADQGGGTGTIHFLSKTREMAAKFGKPLDFHKFRAGLEATSSGAELDDYLARLLNPE